MSLFAAAQNNQVTVQTVLGSSYLIPGESTTLQVLLRGARADSRPVAPQIPNTACNFVSIQTQVINMREIVEVFIYRITPAKTGTYTIPSMAMSADGKIYETQPLTFNVHDPSKLQKVDTGVEDVTILAAWTPSKTSLYPGEQAEVNLKIYAPKILNIVNWGMLEPTKENCLAWRFTPSNSGRQRVELDGTTYFTSTFTSSLSGISAGTASLKKTNLPATIRIPVTDPKYGSVLRDFELNLTLPDLNIDITPFPSGAPAGFAGAVGDFQIAAQCQKTNIKSNESTEVILQVGGLGNVAMLQAPSAGESADPDLDWKIIDTSKVTRGSERREVSGVVTFRQLIRPIIDNAKLEEKNTFFIPPYSLSYFNPDTQSYHTISTQPIPVEILPSDEEPFVDNIESNPSKPDEPEIMTDILDNIETPDTDIVLSDKNERSIALWNIVPALLCLFIISLPIQKKLKARFSKTPEQIARGKAWKELTQESDTVGFYSKAGQYIEKWQPQPQSEDETAALSTILKERDTICFQVDKSAQLSQERKNEIIALLRNLSLVILSGIILLSTQSLHAEGLKGLEGPQEAIERYHEAYPSSVDSIYNTPADVFYNLGNSHYQLQQPGAAALAWRRALAVDPTHEQARKNLHFVELEVGAIVPRREAWQDKIAALSITTYQLIFQLSLWLFLLALLAMTILRSKLIVRKCRPFVITLLILTPFTASAAYFGQYFYPDINTHLGYSEQAIVLKTSKLFPQAHRQQTSFQSLPPASLVKIIATRGAWTQVLLLDSSPKNLAIKGWLPTTALSSISQ